MSTQKDIIHDRLFQYIAQRYDHLSDITGIPAPSVRRVLQELVADGRARWVAKDLFRSPGYLRTKQGRHA